MSVCCSQGVARRLQTLPAGSLAALAPLVDALHPAIARAISTQATSPSTDHATGDSERTPSSLASSGMVTAHGEGLGARVASSGKLSTTSAGSSSNGDDDGYITSYLSPLTASSSPGHAPPSKRWQSPPVDVALPARPAWALS